MSFKNHLRFANKYYENNTEYRVLYKAYGLRFIINVSGRAGKFNIGNFSFDRAYKAN